MIMRDKVSGRVFLSEKEAVEWFCRGRRGCEECPMNEVSQERLCRHNAWERPFEAARAMGMEVVRYWLSEDERRRMQDFGARWVSQDPNSHDFVELWAEQPRLICNCIFASDSDDSNPIADRLATCLPEFFPSVSPGERIGVDDVVVVFEDHKEAGK